MDRHDSKVPGPICCFETATAPPFGEVHPVPFVMIFSAWLLASRIFFQSPNTTRATYYKSKAMGMIWRSSLTKLIIFKGWLLNYSVGRNEFFPDVPNINTWAYGGFLKWWYPQIIHFNRVFHYKPSILGYHYFWKHPGPYGWTILFRQTWKRLTTKGIFL